MVNSCHSCGQTSIVDDGNTIGLHDITSDISFSPPYARTIEKSCLNCRDMETTQCNGCEEFVKAKMLEDVCSNTAPHCSTCALDVLTACEECAAFTSEPTEAVTSNGTHPVCPSCIENDFVTCYSCDIAVSDSIAEYDHARDPVCPSCMDEHFHCEDCGCIYHNDQMTGGSNGECICESCYESNYFYCESCCEVIHNDNYGGDSQCENCYTSDDDDDCEVTENPTYPTHFASKFDNSQTAHRRPFGVEIECVKTGGKRSELENGVFNKVLNWDSDPSCGDELITNKLEGLEDLHNLAKALDHLHTVGRFKVNRKCGLHVHIDGSGVEWQGMRKLLKLWLTMQDDIYRHFPESRQTNYSKKHTITIEELDKIDNAVDFNKLLYGRYYSETSQTNKYNSARYHGLNLHSCYYRGTIEFRIHSGTMNYSKIEHWIEFCQLFVDYCDGVEYEDIKIDKVGKLLEACKARGSRDSTIEYFEDRKGSEFG